jgi:hypothetical protein
MPIELQGHIHPESSFATISQWEDIASQFLALQAKGKDTRGGVIQDDPALAYLVNRWFAFQLNIETKRFAPAVDTKNVLDFIEDFVNHKVWGLRREFKTYLPNIDNVKIAYFYSRQDIEPFVLMDDEFVNSLYGSTQHKVTTMRFTTMDDLQTLNKAIDQGLSFDISTFTKNWRPFFKKTSNVVAKLEGDLVAAFKSDAKTIVTDKGNKAASMERLAYPGGDNLCHDFKDCEGEKTYLWNEIIVKPTKILGYKLLNQY